MHKEEGAGLGFSLAGGADLENKVITVSGRVLGGRESQRQWPQQREHLSARASLWGSDEWPAAGRWARF